MNEIKKQKSEDMHKFLNTGVTIFIEIHDEFPKIAAKNDEVFSEKLNELLRKGRSKEIKPHVSNFILVFECHFYLTFTFLSSTEMKGL
ncbi:hypothetical protein ACIQGW_15495 [Lysinibacillus xylanilyticus]|uniref:hypothetical protein n=1 Tax=Lysinibacillus xylanilyticus TaxID=582475 RepID=UPI003800620D